MLVSRPLMLHSASCSRALEAVSQRKRTRTSMLSVVRVLPFLLFWWRSWWCVFRGHEFDVSKSICCFGNSSQQPTVFCRLSCSLDVSGQRWRTVDLDLPVDRGQLFDRSRPILFKIAYLKHNWRYKLGMHELSSAERNARYRRFFELLNNPPGLYQNLFATSVLWNVATAREMSYSRTSHFRLTPNRVAGTYKQVTRVWSPVYITVILVNCVINFGFMISTLTEHQCI
jgi:hypothetical protein